jgi:hypothetical protein
MKTVDHTQSERELILAKTRLADVVALQELEHNPLTDKEILLLDQSLREGWTPEEYRAAVLHAVLNHEPSLAAE